MVVLVFLHSTWDELLWGPPILEYSGESDHPSVLLYQLLNNPPIAAQLKPGINSHFVNTLTILCSGIAFL